MLVIFFATTLAGCSTVKMADFESKPFDKYTYSQIKDGLAIAIHPISNKEESKKYFGTDLLSANILALYVIVVNRESSTEFLLLKDRVSLRQSEHLLGSASNSDSVGSPEAGEDVIIVSAFFLFPMIFVGAQMVTDAFEVKHNFIKKELRSATLSPNESTKGFLYFSLPKENIGAGNFYFSIEITNQRTHNINTFVIPFTFKKG
jgi:hypothetical protein